MDKLKVKKADGQLEEFSEAKVRDSLKRAGANPQTINRILSQLIGALYNGITTKEIYTKVFELFNQYQSKDGYRYSLKQSLIKLGPSGYPFEKFTAKLLEHLGYQTKTQVIVAGQCIEHEVDVDATKAGQRFMVECKYHNRPGTKSHSKDALITQARFEDIQDQFSQPWLVTNTKLTSNAIKYGQCKNIKLIAWRYPQKGSLEQLIEKNHLHPITCFDFLTSHDCQILMQNGFVFLKDLINLSEKRLSQLGLNSAKVKKLNLHKL